MVRFVREWFASLLFLLSVFVAKDEDGANSVSLYSFLALFIEMPKTDEGKIAQNSLMGYGLVIAK